MKTIKYDLREQRFCRLTAKTYIGNSLWDCLCDCGNRKTVRTTDLLHEKVKSCGCYRKLTATKQALQNAENNFKGVKISNYGYRLLYAPEHPQADKNGYVFEHRLVMEKHIGQTLPDELVVHHINGDKLDNRIENLKLMTRAEHTALHRKEE